MAQICHMLLEKLKLLLSLDSEAEGTHSVLKQSIKKIHDYVHHLLLEFLPSLFLAALRNSATFSSSGGLGLDQALVIERGS